jgi:replicative DNA helicase
VARAGIIGNPQPYQFFGTFAGLSFWPGSLTLLAAAPGVGKTSWLLRVIFEAAFAGFPAALGCYEHTVEELKYRLRLQTEAAIAGPHSDADEIQVENLLASGSETVLQELSDRDDTLRAIEEILLEDYGFPEKGPAMLAVDYLQRIPVVGLTGLVMEDQRSGEAAAGLRKLARRHGWAAIVACALRSEHYSNGDDLTALLGDERVPYEADRVLLIRRRGSLQDCGCVVLDVHTLKNRTGPAQDWQLAFWGERFYPTLREEGNHP